jgi:hypothetical protein
MVKRWLPLEANPDVMNQVHPPIPSSVLSFDTSWLVPTRPLGLPRSRRPFVPCTIGVVHVGTGGPRGRGVLRRVRPR